jgi:type II secretory pathway pseudopilin PulG
MTRRHRIPSGPTSGHRGRAAAFTLVELLVVVSIMATLFGLMLAGSRPNIGATTRRAAQQFASVLLATQSRAIGNPQGASVIIEPDGASCREVFSGDRPPMVLATVDSGMPPEDPVASFAPVELRVTNGGALSLGYRIKFHGDEDVVLPESPWFAFDPAQSTVRFRGTDGQSASNTVWPSAGDGNVLHASISCYPARGGQLMEFPKGVGIDLRYSGTGDDPTTTWGGLSAAGEIGLSFDMVGTVDALMRNLATPLPAVRQPVEPIYFLVAPMPDIAADEALASDRAFWVAVQPQTGRVTVSSNLPQPDTASVAVRVRVRAARAAARAAAAIGK